MNKRYREKQRRLQLRMEVFKKYGGAICACCDETCVMFLTLDHVFQNGAEHRRQIKKEGYNCIYKWLKDHDFPPGYRVLCFNCNHGSWLNGGVCPHHGVKILPDIRTPVTPLKVRMRVEELNLPIKSSELRKEEKKKITEFLTSEVTKPLSMHGIRRLGKDRFFAWNREIVRKSVLRLVRTGKMVVAVEPAGRRAGEYMSAKEPEGYDF